MAMANGRVFADDTHDDVDMLAPCDDDEEIYLSPHSEWANGENYETAMVSGDASVSDKPQDMDEMPTSPGDEDEEADRWSKPETYKATIMYQCQLQMAKDEDWFRQQAEDHGDRDLSTHGEWANGENYETAMVSGDSFVCLEIRLLATNSKTSLCLLRCLGVCRQQTNHRSPLPSRNSLHLPIRHELTGLDHRGLPPVAETNPRLWPFAIDIGT
ncbi:hypothetical protein AeMF1_013265 [Aphanomyces euteiches]|nr:hypothetical protein AeMF1_013265 [Aphanomyces euteiches]